MKHLSPDELVDAVEETLPPTRRVHLDECGTCRHEVSQLATILREAQADTVPEPSPLYWQAFADRVRLAIASEPTLPPRMARWFQWPVLVPLAGLAALLVALGSAVTPATDTTNTGMVVSDSALSGSEASNDLDAHWELVGALIDDVDLDAEAQEGLSTSPGAADNAVLQLSLAEQEELARLVREELQRSGG